MTSLNKSQKGFSFVGILLILVAIGVIAFAGLKVYELQQTNSDDTAQSSMTSSDDQYSSTDGEEVTIADIPDAVESDDDLVSAEQLLNGASVGSDTSSVDATLSTF